jgi:ABC-type uncharacterized transport system involved in gliding motility auxiliary subunit
MKKSQVSQILGVLGLVLVLFGAILYGINASNRGLMWGSLAAGGVLMIVFIVLNLDSLMVLARKRSSRYGANMMVMIILFIAVLAIIQTLSTRHNARFDLTRNSRFSLASQTHKLLKSLKKEVNIYGFYKKGSGEKRKAEDLIDQYAHESPHVRYEFIDPDHKPQRAKEMGVTNYNTAVVECGEKKELITELTEESLTNAILKVTRDLTKAVYFLQGHGEKDPNDKEQGGLAIAKEAIEKDGYLVKKLSLFEVDSIPDDAYIVIAAGPTKDLFEVEIEKLKRYLNKGRNAVFMIDPQVSLPNLEKLVSEYGILLDNDIIIDPISRIFGANYTVPVVTQYPEHEITKGFNVATFFPLARSVRIKEDHPETLELKYIAQTGRSAWGEFDLENFKQGKASRDEDDVPAPVSIAVISSKKLPPGGNLPAPAPSTAQSKIVVFGDSDFAANSSFRVSGNGDFFLNAVNYLAEEKDLISIRPKQSLGDRVFLTAKQGRFVFLLCVVLIPVSILTLGTSLFVRKRKKG